MKILVSNDDGILANGIHALIEALSPCHDVYVVAPDRERSAAGHSLTLHTPLRVEELEPQYGAKRCWMTTGTPGDCVKLAINAILSKEELPDLVISGINHGPNLGADILYSGTVSCAMEGAMMGYPSIATSLASMKTDYEAFNHALIHILPNKFLPLLPLLQVVGRQHTVFFFEAVAVIVAVIEATGKSGTRYIIPLFHHQPYTVA